MRPAMLIGWATITLVLVWLLTADPDANADPVPVPAPPLPPIAGTLPAEGFGAGPGVGAPGIGGEPGIGFGAPNLAPAAAGIFLCPGVGAAGSSFGFGGGYCDFNFQELTGVPGVHGNMHVHCEWGGGVPIVEMWNCWRVFPGQPDHPKLQDPDVIPDGWGVPWAIQGPTPDNQWPPPGLAPAAAFAPPPEEPVGPPPGPPPP